MVSEGEKMETMNKGRDADVAQLEAQVQAILDSYMAKCHSTVENINQEVKTFAEETSAVQESWNSIKEAEEIEAKRLVSVKHDWDQTIACIPWFQDISGTVGK